MSSKVENFHIKSVKHTKPTQPNLTSIHLIAREALIDQIVPNQFDKRGNRNWNRKPRPKPDISNRNRKEEKNTFTVRISPRKDRLCWRDPAEAEKIGDERKKGFGFSLFDIFFYFFHSHRLCQSQQHTCKYLILAVPFDLFSLFRLNFNICLYVIIKKIKFS